jgi:hypothetical protein
MELQNKNCNGVYFLLHVTLLSNLESLMKSGNLFDVKDRIHSNILVNASSTQNLWEEEGDWDNQGQLQDKDIWMQMKGQYLGNYFSPYSQWNGISTIEEWWVGSGEENESDIMLLFSKQLLERTDYHVNHTDQMGYITKKTHKATSEIPWHDLSDISEIVFHNRIPMHTLRIIVTK